jgi:putative hydrolase of the HAD superfamily
MKRASPFRLLCCDIGGVLGTNGWDAELRHKVCSHFQVPPESIDERHRLMFDTYERGFMDLETYLRYVFFDAPRAFTLEDLRDYIYTGSLPWPENIALFSRVKKVNGLKLALISNEGQGIAAHRVDTFGLRELADFMVISHCVHLRKPDRQIWQLALDLAQVKAAESIYVDDRAPFVEVAADIGFAAFPHQSLHATREQFQKLGLIAD